MHVPFSGLSVTTVSGMMFFGPALAHDRLERHLRELVGELLLLQKVEQCGIAGRRVGVEVAADRNPHLARDLPDVLDNPVERALAPRSGRICCACRGRRRA
jgi:uncharacterized protein (DUF111 family)